MAERGRLWPGAYNHNPVHASTLGSHRLAAPRRRWLRLLVSAGRAAGHRLSTILLARMAGEPTGEPTYRAGLHQEQLGPGGGEHAAARGGARAARSPRQS